MVDGDEGPQRTADGRYLVIDGRRWRATDPGIPERLRAELVAELMDARRAVRAEGDAARHRVQDAKVALGERGEPWWDEPTEEGRRERVAATYRTLLRHRPEGTTCPSEAARVVGGDGWRSLSRPVRDIAFDLADEGGLQVLQKGRPVQRDVRGPVRVGRGPRFEA
ncbi:DUF3253 domain-containing protein [Phycicoccus sonneratiae]|uniref:DUF3253 domain-containing protein n=1 Tax=Phycicoccus sonneratiae TaxID=2807628 RepID=A0ABS2CNI2_9MICO|nr:DUF3253 domain-containing protein [Phycicoccus sonneraticus]MBM6401393.1 DUF3253 domain-containing protein [Phycicoccus sonneraticus]